MKASGYVCDTCGVGAVATGGSIAPPGWYVADIWATERELAEIHACSPGCMAEALRRFAALLGKGAKLRRKG